MRLSEGKRERDTRHRDRNKQKNALQIIFFKRVYNTGTNYNSKMQLVKKYPFGSFGGEGMD